MNADWIATPASQVPRSRRAAATCTVTLGLLLATAVALAGQELPRLRPRWHETVSGNLRVAGSVDEATITAVETDLRRSEAVYYEQLGLDGHRSSLPMEVLIFKRPTELQRYQRRADGTYADTSLVSVLDRRGRLAAVSMADLGDGAILRRLLVSDLVRQSLPSAPPWLRLALPALFATLRPPAAGAAIVFDARTETARWPPANELLNAQDSAGEAAAESLLRHLLRPGSDRATQFGRYLTLLRASAPESLAFEEAFAATFEAIVDEASHSPTVATVELGILAPRADPVALRPLAYSQVLTRLGDLIARSQPWNDVASELHHQTALEATPGDARALRGVAVARQHEGRTPEAVQWYERSLAAAPEDVSTLVLLAWTLLDDFRQHVASAHGWETTTPTPVAAARRHSQVALHLAADNQQALHCFGASFLFEAEIPDAAIDALRRSVVLSGSAAPVLVDLAAALAHRGELEEAWLIRQGLRLLNDGRAASLEAVLIEDALFLANEALRAGDLPTARRLLALTADESGDPRVAESLAQVEVIAEQMRRDRLIELHNRAYELIQAGEWDRARAILVELRDAELSDELRQSVERLEAALPR